MAHLFKMHYSLAKESIRANRSRSFLTCLGIAIGVASITLIMSLAGSISNFVQSEIGNLGPELIVVRPTSRQDSVTSIVEELTQSNAFQNSSLLLSDLETISKIDDVAAVSPIATSYNTVMSEKNTLDTVQILGTNADFANIESVTVKYGSFLPSQNDPSGKVVLGRTLSLKLFNTLNSTVGKTVTIMGEKFLVVGVLDEIDNSINLSGINLDEALIMDIQSLSKIIPSVQIQQINIKANNTDSLVAISQTIQDQLLQNRKDNNFSVTYGDAITHPSSTLFTTISGILLLIAAISLIVGGIGVMNIMLVSVSERTKEIGIRKSVGASSQNILMQFLLEAIMLSTMGGFTGIILGYILAFLISIITPFAPFISWEILLITILVTLLVGIVFGTYPAIKAASKDPIESLKNYR